jgi:hypothetical protein
MPLNFETGAAAIQQQYGLSDEQMALLQQDVGKLSPQRQASLSEAYVLSWKTVNEGVNNFACQPPKLAVPDLGEVMRLSGWTGDAAYPSPGATIAAVLTELAAEQRKENRQQFMEEAESIAATMKDQAADLRKKADTQWTMALVSGIITGVAGLASVIGASMSLAKTASLSSKIATVEKGVKQDKIADIVKKLDVSDHTEALSKLKDNLSTHVSNMAMHKTIIDGINAVAQATGSIVTAKGQHDAAYIDADIKEKDAHIEKRRAFMENMRALDQALTDLINKVLSASESIQQATNQARSRILG